MRRADSSCANPSDAGAAQTGPLRWLRKRSLGDDVHRQSRDPSDPFASTSPETGYRDAVKCSNNCPHGGSTRLIGGLMSH
jgi:hypothetical protein